MLRLWRCRSTGRRAAKTLLEYVLDGLRRDRLQRLLAGNRDGVPFVLAGSP
jgi:hypothetical protein